MLKDPDAAPNQRLRLWGTLSGLLTFGLMLPLWSTLAKVRTIYDELDFRRLPVPTELAMSYGPLLWIPAMATAMLGFVMARVGRRDRAERLFFWMAIIIVCLQLLMLVVLSLPFTLAR